MAVLEFKCRKSGFQILCSSPLAHTLYILRALKQGESNVYSMLAFEFEQNEGQLLHTFLRMPSTSLGEGPRNQ